jgi:FkbM family methyltransferase
MSALSKAWKSITTTRTVDGPWWYFHVSYLLYALSSVLGRLHKPWQSRIRGLAGTVLSRDFTITNSVGTFAVTNQNDSLSKSLSTFEAHLRDWVGTEHDGAIFLDIGANIGFYTIYALRHGGFTHAIAFEPHPTTFDRLKKNIHLNALNERTTLKHIAASDQTATLSLSEKSWHTDANSLEHADTGTSVNITAQPLDTIAEIEPEKISLIKIDVEGHELNTLRGMQDVLRAVPVGTNLIIEIQASNQVTAETFLKLVGFNQADFRAGNNYRYKKTA